MKLTSRGGLLLLLVTIPVLLVLYSTIRAQGGLSIGTLTVSPQEDTTTVLQNPMMGFEDHNINGTWWPFGTGYLRAITNCERNGSMVQCGPLNWDRLHPAQGTYNLGDIDLFLSNMRDRQKVAAFRVRTIAGPGTTPAIPTWAKNAGVTSSPGREPWGGDLAVEVDYHKCAFLDAWGQLVNELVRKYDNHPQVAYVDVGSYGFYGEWFSGKTVLQRAPSEQVYDPTDPTLQQSIDTRTRIIRMFTGGSGSGRCLDNTGREVVVNYSYPGFKNKPVILNRGDKEDVAIGVANGTGIRFDGVGAIDGRQKAFRDAVGAYVEQIWRTKPIMGEFGTPDYAPVDSGLMMRSLCFAREFYVSSLHNNFVTKPSVDMEPLFRELGYRIVLQQASYPSAIASGSPVTFNFTWLNKGTAPAYTRYPLFLYFKPRGQDTVVAQVELTDTNIRAILPAGVSAKSNDFRTCTKGTPQPYTSTQTFTVPPLAAGVYDLYFAFMEPIYNKPIQIAHSQKDSAGRYLLGQVTVGAGGPTPTLQPTNTPSGPTPTVQPTLGPSPTPGVVTGNPLRAQYQAGEPTVDDDQIVPVFNVINASPNSVALSELKLRYYFTRDTSKTLNFRCDYASLSCSKVTGRFVRLATPVAGADHYLEVGFTSTAGMLAAGGETGEIAVRVYKSDWSNFNEANDYSYDASRSWLADFSRITLHRAGTLVWGVVPGGSGGGPKSGGNAAIRSAYILIEAETFDTPAPGAVIERSLDSTGGHSVTATSGAPLTFSQVDFGHGGPGSVQVRVSAMNGAKGIVELRVGDPTNGIKVGEIELSAIGSGWQTVTSAISAQVTGVQSVYVVVKGGGAARIDSFQFTPRKGSMGSGLAPIFELPGTDSKSDDKGGVPAATSAPSVASVATIPAQVTRRGQLYWKKVASGCISPTAYDAWSFELPPVRGQTGRNVWFEAWITSGDLKLDLSPYTKWYNNTPKGQGYTIILSPVGSTQGCYSLTIHSNYEED